MSSENGNGAALAVLEPERHLAPTRLTADVQGVKLMVDQVRELQANVLRPGVDFGVIPGTGDKPCLLKPGAESLLAAFNLSVGQPQIEIVPIEHEIPGHREYRIELPIINRATGQVVGYGVGSCSTLESKYRFRNAQRVCPNCGKMAIHRSKPEYGGGWYCWKKKDGCGAEFHADDRAITDQVVGQLENTNPADQYNTVLKMGKKRGLVDAALTTTAASGVFTQDVEEDADYDQPADRPQARQAQAPPARQQQPANQQRSAQPQRPAAPPEELPIDRMIKVTLSDGKSGNSNGPVVVWMAKDVETGKSARIWCWLIDKAELACQKSEYVEESTATVFVRLELGDNNGKPYYRVIEILPAKSGDEPLDADYDELGPPIEDGPILN
jgi:hypothetical protein